MNPPALAALCVAVGVAWLLPLEVIIRVEPVRDAAEAVDAKTAPRNTCELHVQVVVLGLPEASNKNAVVFDSVAEALTSAFGDAGVAASRLDCSDLRACLPAVDSSAQLVVVGSNVAAHYHAGDASQPLLPSVFPNTTVLFNLEHIPAAGTASRATHTQSWVDAAFVDVHRRFVTWDYSAANVAKWAQLGVGATLVPLGYHPRLVAEPTPPVFDDDKAYDVLFFGTANARRRQVLDDMAAGGVNVTWVTAWGAELEAAVRQSKIVLMLRSFDELDEFKMTRLQVALANGAFVLSEDMGSPEDMGPFTPHVARVPTFNLVAALKRFLRLPYVRHLMARQGYEWFTANHTQLSFVRPHVDEWRSRRPHC